MICWRFYKEISRLKIFTLQSILRNRGPRNFKIYGYRPLNYGPSNAWYKRAGIGEICWGAFSVHPQTGHHWISYSRWRRRRSKIRRSWLSGKTLYQRGIKKAVEKSLQYRKVPKAVPHEKPPFQGSKTTVYAGIVGQSKETARVIDIIERVRNNRATILIQGESGTGKELVARAIHYKGSFSGNPFIAVNCGAIPENLLEAELFGYVKVHLPGQMKPGTVFFRRHREALFF